MGFQPLDDRILVKLDEVEVSGATKVDGGISIANVTMTEGGIALPQTVVESKEDKATKPLEGFVVSTGAGRLLPSGTRASIGVKAGEKVAFGRYSGVDKVIDGVKHVVLREHEVLCVVEA